MKDIEGDSEYARVCVIVCHKKFFLPAYVWQCLEKLNFSGSMKNTDGGVPDPYTNSGTRGGIIYKI